MKIGIIGAGNVGGTLGKRWTSSGHRVKFGVRNPNDAKILKLRQECGPQGLGPNFAFKMIRR